MIVIVVLSCWTSTPVDPDLRAKREAVEGFERARAMLDAGDAAGARVAFARLPEVHPIVRAWEARAAAEAGDVEGAVVILDQLVARRPEIGLARYNRAAYLARLGRLDAAGQELTVALELRAATLREAVEDPDFAPHLDHPAFALVAANALVVAVDPPPSSTFLGSEVRLTLRVTGAGDAPITVSSPSAQGPVTLVEHIESVTDPLEGPGRKLTWAWRIEGPGTVVLDPLVVQAGALSTEAAGATVEAAAPPDRGDPTPRPIAFPVASTVGVGLDVGAARWVDGRLQVKVDGSDRVSRTPPGPPPVRYLFREGGVTKWVIEEHADEPAIASVQRITGPRTAAAVKMPDRR